MSGPSNGPHQVVSSFVADFVKGKPQRNVQRSGYIQEGRAHTIVLCDRYNILFRERAKIRCFKSLPDKLCYAVIPDGIPFAGTGAQAAREHAPVVSGLSAKNTHIAGRRLAEFREFPL